MPPLVKKKSGVRDKNIIAKRMYLLKVNLYIFVIFQQKRFFADLVHDKDLFTNSFTYNFLTETDNKKFKRIIQVILII